jgi:UDP-N-acetylmuramate--alanine ligase
MQQKIHFIGIGGIGVSALARYYAARGYAVSGSDMADSPLLDDLRREGIAVTHKHARAHVPAGCGLVIYSAAVHEDNPEYKAAQKAGIPLMSYAEALGALTKQYVTLAVAGSNGKSTTTALLALMLVEAGLDPTVIVGTRLKEFGGSNMRLGKSRYLVIEADEYNRSFWHHAPRIAIITNIDADHLDIYKNLAGVIAGFRRYVTGLPPGAIVVANAADKNSMRALKGVAANIVYFHKSGAPVPRWKIGVPGAFNRLNAEAAWRAAKLVGVTKAAAVRAAAAFRGSWRRMEELAPIAGTRAAGLPGLFFADYAHHPTKIAATIAALREAHPKKHLFIVFQPHQRERLTFLFKAFLGAFAGADTVGILPTYEVLGRESGAGKTAEDLCRGIARKQHAVYLKKLEEAFTLIPKDGLTVFMGAGSIDALTRKYFKSKLMPM